MHTFLPMRLWLPLLIMGCAAAPPVQHSLVQPPSLAFPDSQVFPAAFAETWDATLAVVGTRFIASMHPETGEMVTMWTETTTPRPVAVSKGPDASQTVQRQMPVRERSRLRLHVTRAGPTHTQVDVFQDLEYVPPWEHPVHVPAETVTWHPRDADPATAFQVLQRIQQTLARRQQMSQQAVRIRPPQQDTPAPRLAGWLGVRIQTLSRLLARVFDLPVGSGALVTAVIPESPAAQAGLQRGDVILAVDAHAVQDAGELVALVAALPPGEVVNVAWLRRQRRHTASVVLGHKPTPALSAAPVARPSPRR